jgi:hypothetical protein
MSPRTNFVCWKLGPQGGGIEIIRNLKSVGGLKEGNQVIGPAP